MLKKGATAISVTLIVIIGICLICVFVAFLINSITPLILQQKLQEVATKYMYVIERYGYFTDLEKDSLLEELSSKGFDGSRINLSYPSIEKPYGEVIELVISYKYKSIPIFGMEDRNITVSKVSYSKR